MATIVIVHGGWDGGWFWKRPAQSLRKRGHEVYTPTLTGLGESYDARVNAHPAKTFQTALSLTNPDAVILPRTYISCTQRGNNPVMAPLFVCAQKARAAGWDFYELDANHNPHIAALEATVELLDRIADNAR